MTDEQRLVVLEQKAEIVKNRRKTIGNFSILDLECDTILELIQEIRRWRTIKIGREL